MRRANRQKRTGAEQENAVSTDVPGAVAPLTERTAPHSPDALAAALAGLHYPASPTYDAERS